MVTMSSDQGRHKSHEHLLSPRTKPKSAPVAVEVGYQNSVTSSSSLRVKTLQSSNGEGCQEQLSSLHTERQLLKNMVILGMGFVFVFSAFTALQSLQSSLFLETGLGLQALTIVYSLMVISCLYGPVFVQKLTPNWTIVLSFVMVALFISTFFYPRLYTLVPSAVLLGLSLGPLFCAKTTFLMQLVSRMTYLTEGIRDKVQQRYLRLFYLFFNSSRVWGNLITAIILHYGGDVYVYSTRPQYPRLQHGVSHNMPLFDLHMSPSLYATVARPSLCILDQHSLDGVFRKPTSYLFILPSNVSLMLISVFLGLTFLGVAMVTTLLDKFDLYINQDPLERPLCIQTVRKIGLAFVDPQLRLMFPIVVFIGLEQGFILADYTRSYVSCALGLESVGYTMMCMGAMNTVGALAVHQFSKHIKRPLIMAAGLIFQSGLLMVLWLWRPVRDDVAVFYVIAAGWGLCNAIWETLTMTFIATTYTDDWQAPFAAYFTTQALGLTVAFGYSFYLCNIVKIYVLAGVLLVAIIPYSFLEFRFHQQHKLQERTAML